LKYKKIKLTVSKRFTAEDKSVVSIPVNEKINIPQECFGVFYLRKSFCVNGIIQLCHTPFPEHYFDTPVVVIKNDSLVPFELLAGEEIGEIWVFGEKSDEACNYS